MSQAPAIETLEQARRHAAGTVCAGCQKAATLSAYQVQKEGPNRGRFFVKCRHCGHFAWLGAAATVDEELERVQAGAAPCPKCGKGRRADRVRKEGPNKGRLFLTCADPACDSFAWASPASSPRPARAVRPAPNEGQRTEEALLAAIGDNPEDDAPRLIYADWLDEHGEAERAELIRAQVALGSMAPDGPARGRLEERARTLLEGKAEAWAAALKPLVLGYHYARGLIDAVEVDAARFPESADEVLRLAPSAALRVPVNSWQEVKTLVRCKQLLRVRRLALPGERMGGAGAWILAESPHVANLKGLSLAGQSLGQPGAQALAASRYLANLEVLDLTATNLARSAVTLLAGSPNLPRLKRLLLGRNLLNDSDVRALANSLHLKELRELDLSGNAVTSEGMECLAAAPLLARLRRLDLTGSQVGPRGLYLLRQSPHARSDLAIVC
jgi:uncharacterized protein (TIGR02996 family)